MTNQEKIYLLNKCIEEFKKAENFMNNAKIYEAIETHGKAKMLKELIEMFIDCQPTKYYNKYQQIVMLYKKW